MKKISMIVLIILLSISFVSAGCAIKDPDNDVVIANTIFIVESLEYDYDYAEVNLSKDQKKEFEDQLLDEEDYKIFMSFAFTDDGRCLFGFNMTLCLQYRLVEEDNTEADVPPQSVSGDSVFASDCCPECDDETCNKQTYELFSTFEKDGEQCEEVFETFIFENGKIYFSIEDEYIFDVESDLGIEYSTNLILTALKQEENTLVENLEAKYVYETLNYEAHNSKDIELIEGLEKEKVKDMEELKFSAEINFDKETNAISLIFSEYNDYAEDVVESIVKVELVTVSNKAYLLMTEEGGAYNLEIVDGKLVMYFNMYYFDGIFTDNSETITYKMGMVFAPVIENNNA